MDESLIASLIRQAMRVRENSYAPYSRFRVGAALLTKNGAVYSGVNVENASYPAGICAERSAFCQAVAQGERDFAAIAIVGGRENTDSRSFPTWCFPCGICRQFMAELCKEDFLVIVAKSETDYRVFRMQELLPQSFSLTDPEN